MELLLKQIDLLEQRIASIENSLVFRFNRAAGRKAKALTRVVGSLPPVRALVRLLLGGKNRSLSSEYRRWLAAQPAGPEPSGIAPACGYQPTISILMPVFQPSLAWLKEAVDSVLAQSWQAWELCIAADGTPEPSVDEYLAALRNSEPRVRIAMGERSGIASTLNRAAALATGDYLAFLDQDDFLVARTLEFVVGSLQEERSDLLYSDEDFVDEGGVPERPNFKPGWSPELLLRCMYMGHLLVVSRRVFESVGGFRAGFDGAQDYDLALRLSEAGAVVRRIPRVLYHWRMHRQSTARGPAAKPYAEEAAWRALAAAIDRRGWRATVEPSPAPNTFQLRWGNVSVNAATIVIPSRDPGLLSTCLKAIHPVIGNGAEVIVVHHIQNSIRDSGIERLAAGYGARRVAYQGPFNFSRMANLGAAHAGGDFVVLMNDDVLPMSQEWLAQTIGNLERPDVGVVGARLLYPDGTIQHAGITLGIGEGTGHAGRHTVAADLWPWLDLTRDVSAVTGAFLAVRKALFQELGGFDERFSSNYNDVDFCLRAREKGYRVIADCSVVMVHREGASRSPGTRLRERLQFWHRWGHSILRGDPFYSPHLTAQGEDLSFRIE